MISRHPETCLFPDNRKWFPDIGNSISRYREIIPNIGKCWIKTQMAFHIWAPNYRMNMGWSSLLVFHSVEVVCWPRVAYRLVAILWKNWNGVCLAHVTRSDWISLYFSSMSVALTLHLNIFVINNSSKNSQMEPTSLTRWQSKNEYGLLARFRTMANRALLIFLSMMATFRYWLGTCKLCLNGLTVVPRKAFAVTLWSFV